ncbi:HEPN domain-containing protein [Peptoniphilus genitalis]|uniref:ApeA N-terminal domain-containing protein n=1 Tax=Peptoniphilus genitalis TaxID=3036303 RepID=A0ABY4TLP4_9FIRM|nr:HEPN domain-containing protein [Peptoniphilus sp. SAHP1]URN41388.1 hypothetical protein M9426_09015 [Peptoniphilus sp. SAHP1]
MGNIKSFNLDNNYSIEGMWAFNLGDLFEKKSFTFSGGAIPGKLELSEGRITLDINGCFNGFGSDYDKNIYRIYGYLSSGLFVILEKCFIINSAFSAPGYVVEKYLANVAYILDKDPIYTDFNIEEKIIATKVNFGIDYLDNWYNIDLPSFDYSSDSKAVTIHYNNEFFDKNKFEILDGKYIISLKKDIKANQVIHQGAQVKTESYISIYTKDYKTETIEIFMEIANWTLKLSDFLTQIFGRYTYFEFYLEDKMNRRWIEDLGNGECKFHSPKYKGRLIFRQALKESPKLKINSLRLSDIKDDYGELLKTWFEEKDKLQYIIDLYYQNMNSSLEIETILVNKIKMMETYYDNFLQSQEKSTDKDLKFNEAREKIKNFMDSSELEESTKEEVNRCLDKNKKNNITLREKLEAVLERFPDELKVVFSEMDPNWKEDTKFIFNFSRRLKDTRNFYTHGANNQRNRNRFTTTDEFLSASLVLDFVIYYFVLRSLYGENRDERIYQYPFLKAKLRK